MSFAGNTFENGCQHKLIKLIAYYNTGIKSLWKHFVIQRYTFSLHLLHLLCYVIILCTSGIENNE